MQNGSFSQALNLLSLLFRMRAMQVTLICKAFNAHLSLFIVVMSFSLGFRCL